MTDVKNAAVTFRKITKQFGTVTANRAVSFTVRAGSIHGIIGENGAGKSTLMSMLYGLLSADDGEIDVFGETVHFRSPADAIDAGIGMVHQHFQLVEPMSVLDNIILGAEGSFSLSRAKAKARTAMLDLADRYGLTVDPDAVIEDLPVGLRQRVEILKALIRGAEILILDEPTAVLTPEETDRFFVNLRRLKEEGKTIIIISHKLREIIALADHVTVMRGGAVVADLPTTATDEAGLATLMIGHPREQLPRAVVPIGQCVLAARGLTIRDGLGIARLDHVDLDLHEGEITGIAGVAGNGQTELLAALSGLAPAEGTLSWLGAPVPLHNRAAELRRLGLAHIPEDRLGMGIIPEFEAWESMILGTARDRNQSKRGLLRLTRILKSTQRRMADWEVRPLNARLKTGHLSGGNQQKLVAAREVDRKPLVLLVGQPTRGVDIGAIDLIHRRLMALKEAGAAILLVSVELDEILALSDRILVMSGGKIGGSLTRDQADEATLGLLMAGCA